MVAKLYFEPLVESHFDADSYGYRPNRSAHQALAVTGKRCWQYDWVLEFDIKGLFDNIDHDRLMKAVRWHTDNRWLLLYIERWLTAPIQLADGTTVSRSRGVPQGGVISPLFSNIYMRRFIVGFKHLGFAQHSVLLSSTMRMISVYWARRRQQKCYGRSSASRKR